MESGGLMPIHKGSPIIPILSRINPITRIDTYLLKAHSHYTTQIIILLLLLLLLLVLSRF